MKWRSVLHLLSGFTEDQLEEEAEVVSATTGRVQEIDCIIGKSQMPSLTKGCRSPIVAVLKD